MSIIKIKEFQRTRREHELEERGSIEKILFFHDINLKIVPHLSFENKIKRRGFSRPWSSSR
jgi:hypothetical protein